MITLLYWITKWISFYFKKKIGFQDTRVFINIYQFIKNDTLSFYASLDIPIFQIYGTSETGGLISLTNSLCTNNVGFPVMQVLISDSDQILVKGEHLNDYHVKSKDWFYTGDTGKLLETGQLQVFGRAHSKDLKLNAIKYFFLKNLNLLFILYNNNQLIY